MRVVRSAEIELPILRNLVQNLAEYYFKTLTDNQVQMYAEDLLEMGSDLSIQAAKQYRASLCNTSFPLPAHLKQTVGFFDTDFLMTG